MKKTIAILIVVTAIFIMSAGVASAAMNPVNCNAYCAAKGLSFIGFIERLPDVNCEAQPGAVVTEGRAGAVWKKRCTYPGIDGFPNVYDYSCGCIIHNIKNLDKKVPIDPPVPIPEPVSTDWHELYPVFCNDYHLSSWHDNGDGELSPSDQIGMTDKNGKVEWYHVEEVTITITVSKKLSLVETMFIDFEDGYELINDVMNNPNSTQWQEVYPEFCKSYRIVKWSDNGDGKLSPYDQIILKDKVTGEQAEWHVDEVNTNIILSPKPCIEVNKTVWNPATGKWEKSRVAKICDIVRFNCTIHAKCCNLTGIVVTDILSDSLNYSKNAIVHYPNCTRIRREPDVIQPIPPIPGGPTRLEWYFEAFMRNKSETITIEFDAHMVKCGNDTNTQNATAWCLDPATRVSDADTVWVNCTQNPLWHEINEELDALLTNVSATDMPNIIKQRLIDKLEYAKALKDNAHEECEAGNFDGATKKLGVAKNQVESFASMVEITRRICAADKASFLADATEIIEKIDRLIEDIETEHSC